MTTSIVPTLSAILVMMTSRTILKKLGPVTKAAFLPPTPLSLRRRFAEISSQKVEVEVETHQNLTISPEQFALWAWLPTNSQPFSKKFPDFAKSIISDLPEQLGKNVIGEETKITNNLSHFQAVDNRWARVEESISKLNEHSTKFEKKLNEHSIKLEHIIEEWTEFKHFMTLGEMYAVMDIVTSLLHSRSLVGQHQKSRTGHTVTLKPTAENHLREKDGAEAARNEMVHTLQLQPSLLIVEKMPDMELFFDALFGLPSAEAKKLSQFDKSHIFHVEVILSHHSLLWKSGTANKFIEPYRQWLEAMRKLVLLSQIQPEDASFTAAADIAKKLAEEARSIAAVDIAYALDHKHINTQKAKGHLNSKMRDSSTSQYYWEGVLTDWEDRGLLGRIVAEWESLYS